MASKKASKPGPRGAKIHREFLRRVRSKLDAVKGAQWPNAKWQKDPVGFVRSVLGGEPLPHQIKLLEAVALDPAARVAVRSGQKTGKTKTVIWLALWFYCSFPDAHVHMTATTKDQVENVLWGELGKTIRAARERGFEIEVPYQDPSKGLRSADGSRVIRGFTVRDVEAMSGLSGEMFFIVDEASSLPERVWQAIEGNTIGVARIVMISNPTRTDGPYFDAFHKETLKKYWQHFHFDSEEIARECDARGVVVRGIANLAKIDQWAELYKRDSPFFLMRVKGEFIVNEAGKIIGFGLIAAAQEAWDKSDVGTGVLSLGIDPAGPGSGGDEWAFALVRGSVLLALFTFRGLSEEAGLEHTRAFLKTYRRSDEIPRVMVDSEGSIGASFFGRLKAIEANLARKRPDLAFECFGVKSSHNARRESNLYDKIRDELWANLARWMKDGGTIPPDHELERQLNLVAWLGSNHEKLKATPKEGPGGLREKLGRSPDHADALCLAVWEPYGFEKKQEERDVEEEESWGVSAGRSGRGEENDPGAHDIDPYGGRIDPYGGKFDPYAR